MSDTSRVRGLSHHGPDDVPIGPGARRSAIIEKVMAAGTIRIEDLPETFGVSLMTVHRDLDTLASQGLLRKTRGMVTALSNTRSDPSTEFRSRLNTTQKESVTAVALGMIEPGQSVFMDDSTTGLYLAARLSERQPLTVITNFQPMLDNLITNPELTLIALGGQYYPWCRAYMGSVTLATIRSLRADIFFMSTAAVTDEICFDQHHETVQVKRAMFESARTRVAYVDHSKFERRALHALGPLSDFDAVIVDEDTPKDRVRSLERGGTTVIVARSVSPAEAVAGSSEAIGIDPAN